MKIKSSLRFFVLLSFLAGCGGCDVSDIDHEGDGTPTRTDGASYFGSGTSYPVWMADGQHIIKTGDWGNMRKSIVMYPGNMEIIPADMGYRLTDWGHVDMALASGVVAIAAYDTLGGEDLDLYLVSLSDLELRQLTNTSMGEGMPSWSPDGTLLAFGSGEGAWTRIEIMEPAIGERQVLVSGPDLNWYPAWSPDGTRIAFTSNRSGSWQVWTVSLDGTDFKQLTDMEIDGSMNHPTWSPDGSRIAFGAGGKVWLVDSGGGEAELFASDANGPAWSPLGDRISFADSWGYGGALFWYKYVN